MSNKLSKMDNELKKESNRNEASSNGETPNELTSEDYNHISRNSASVNEGQTSETGESSKTSHTEEESSSWMETPERLMGTKGFISSLLNDVLTKELPKQEDEVPPIQFQNVEERKASIMAVASDLDSFFKMRSAKLLRSARSRRRSMSTAESAASADRKEDKLPSQRNIPPQYVSSLKSDWKPGDDTITDEDMRNLIKRQHSWVGQYIEGYDYWSEENKKEKEQKKVTYTLDNSPKMWYDVSLASKLPSSRSSVDVSLNNLRTTTAEKGSEIKAMKFAAPDDLAQKRKSRLSVAAIARKPPSDEEEEWPEDFPELFADFAKADDFTANGSRISMANVDNWLEKAGILDHKALTSVHTGFCFLSTGGSRFRGLSYEEFIHFLKMIALTKKMPFSDLISDLYQCKPDAEVPEREM